MPTLLDVIERWIKAYKPTSTREKEALAAFCATLQTQSFSGLQAVLLEYSRNDALSVTVLEKLRNWWRMTLDLVDKNQQALINLAMLQDFPLTNFITDLLAKPSILLYTRAQSLLNRLQERSSLERLLTFMHALSKAPLCQKPPKGSFEALRSQYAELKQLLDLLNNVCGFISDVSHQRTEDNPLAQQANALLQCALSLYVEHNAYTLSIQTSERDNPEDCCTCSLQ